MSTIRWNRRNSYQIDYVGGTLTLYPGINLAVDEEIVKEIKKHPIVKTLIEQGVLEVLLRTKEPTSDIEGIPVIDGLNEPLPVLPVGDRSAAKVRVAKVQANDG